MLNHNTVLEGKKVRHYNNKTGREIIGTVCGINIEYNNAIIYGDYGYPYKVVCKINELIECN